MSVHILDSFKDYTETYSAVISLLLKKTETSWIEIPIVFSKRNISKWELQIEDIKIDQVWKVKYLESVLRVQNATMKSEGKLE